MATATQTRETAAEILGILGEGETLPSYETADLDQAYTEVFSELQALNLTTWAESADVPDQYARSVAMLVAEARAVKYQIPDARYQRIKLEKIEAMRMIRELQARAKMGQTEIENF
ncbi:MAG: hypothetical protein KOO63_08220 [Bacteroidales bacterium]|nr:hypothetical protein [Candidatus Latescibacterota bacterium]